MTEAKAIELMTRHLESLFPKKCPNCQREFATLRDFFLQATPVGKPISYDLDVGDARPIQPVGAVALSNCACGSTVALTSEGMPLTRLWLLLDWIKQEAKRRHEPVEDYLLYLRWQVRKNVLGRPDSHEPKPAA